LTPLVKPAAAQLVTSGGTPTVQGYYNTAGQYVAATGGPLPAGVTPDITISAKAYLAVTPDPVGIGQTILVNIWTVPGIDVQRYRTGYTVTITKPDKTTETVGPLNSFKGDGTAYFMYTVNQVGTWSFQFSYPGDYYPAGNYTENAGAVFLMGAPTTNVSFPLSMYYTPSTSPVTSITVQQAMVASWPPSPLPTDYWTRPISPENREWWVIAGNYPPNGHVGGGPEWPANTNTYPTVASGFAAAGLSYVPYVQAPNTAHIVWRLQIGDAGLIGGTEGQKSFLGGGFGAGPAVIYNGRAYQTMQVGDSSLLECYDIQTGQVYWQIPNPIPTTSFFGFTMQGSMYISYITGTAETPGGSASSMGAGVSLVCLGNNLVKIDPFSGQVTLNVTGMSGTYYDDPFVLSVQATNPYYPYFGPPSSYYLVNWSIAGSDSVFTDRVVSNITWPLSSLPSTTDFEQGVAVNIAGISPGGPTFNTVGTMLTGYSVTTGTMLWNTTTTGTEYSMACAVADQGKVAVLMQDGCWHAWNIQTGAYAWTSQQMAYPWGASAFGDYGFQSAYGLLYRESYDGVYAFNWTNGNIAWHFMAPSVPFETPYSGNYSFNGGGVVADGKLYTYNTEHTATNPVTRGWRLFCINATTGAGIWNITGTMTPGAVADGYLTASNGYDGYMYVFGMGQSATTVTAPDTAITTGQNVVISGTVLDESPGHPGTPCVSAKSMTQWMEYLYMQTQCPANVTGVPVSIDAVDPNGNNVHITTVTSDASGTFGYTWTPTTPGQWKITATFAGDDSYGSSWAETYATVTAPTPTATPTPTAAPAASVVDTYFVPAVIAIILAIVIVGALIILMQRKRPLRP
jgi:hypothetical protein